MDEAIRIGSSVVVTPEELDFHFIRASGPGGQNVNKVASAVQLRFDVAGSPGLSSGVKERLKSLSGRRMTQQGVLTITAQRFRTQERNRQDAVERLVALLNSAAVAPVPRRPTRPTLGSKQRRLEGKSRRADIKQMRQRTGDE